MNNISELQGITIKKQN